ncbi:MAG: sel1 repeat family protein [Opitutus sp.]|nr:sel1 repeat family protein [Opitutus sp.]
MSTLFLRQALGWAAAVASAGWLPLQAANPPKKAADTAAPVLMSRTGGGGGSWSDVKELQQAAAKGNPKAEAQLGEMLLRGDGIAKDEKRAVAMLEKAARAGHSAAAFRIGMLLANGESGVARDPGRALAYFRAAAAGGEKEAFFNIGAAHASARGVKRDYGEALGWLIVARQRGADPGPETSLRAQIRSQPAWIAKGERRAKEIEQEFAGRKLVELLPAPAPLEAVAEPPKSEEPLKPKDELKPAGSMKPAEALRPADFLRPIEPPKPSWVLPPKP